ncbi:GGDEF domain-containing protein [Nitrosophilus alvini]|uniref:GGDEF domain-containing protein n=1 Tax=Nitrosophilus alvini TaxID=2714855 RepID=UPI00190E1533|nr:GGDEF domain-containing protein [Nitrosophilus alvini]
MKNIKVFKKNSIIVWLVFLVVTLSAVSFYNYHIQKNILLKQMQSDAKDIVNSITAAIKRFHDIKSTMNLQKLVSDMSLGLDIFEFRYLKSDGVISNSMFEDEIGKIHDSKSFRKTMQGDMEFGKFFFETRDYVDVMAIYYPISMNNDLVGIIDLAVEVPQYALFGGQNPKSFLVNKQTDIMNLLKAIEGSIKNSISIFEETDIEDFLDRYVHSAENILQITVIDQNGTVVVSSNKELIGKRLSPVAFKNGQIAELNGRPVYRMLANEGILGGDENKKLMLLIDAAPYKKNEKRLLQTALITSAVALFIALFIARAIYRSAIEQSREEKERLERLVKERTKEIELLSKTDSLTGLWNRRYLEEMLEMEFKRARRYGHNISILIVDLDHFKHINDTYGHMAGDEVLRQVSERIHKSIRETDFVGRYGGEEIVVILPETDIKTAKIIADKIRHSIADKPVLFEEYTIKITASIGISNLQTEHKDYHEVFSEADEALYRAKKEGRNRVVVYKNRED